MCPDKNQCISAKLLKLKGFKIQHKIGSGSFSTVYKALTDNEQHTEVAIKCIDKTKVSENRFDSIVNEIKALKLLHHQHIVTMLDFLWDERYVYIILEYCDGGDLCSFIRSHEKLSEFQCQQFVRQLVLALKFLRENNVCHFDLKPQNILIKNNTLKLADFGFAQFLAPNDQGDSIQGSPLYMAPEILAGSPYNAKADLWSLGVLVFEALFGHAPYASCNLSQLRAQALSSAPITIPPNSLSPDCMDFLSRLLQKDPMRRISYEDLFSHPYPDLIHAPCAESHQTAIRIVTDAIHHDRENNSRRAFSLYCEALNYLIPLAYGKQKTNKITGTYKRIDIDLKYLCVPPCAESYETAIRIVTDAIHHDRENNSRQVFSLYCEALNYLIPLAYGKQKTNKITGTYKRIDIDLKYLCVLLDES
ncbi:hypothetical protein M8J77_018043 [Diaphorina citri]|nr:hypothetical protein M8J77_018043 [Diaphorina citri]